MFMHISIYFDDVIKPPRPAEPLFDTIFFRF